MDEDASAAVDGGHGSDRFHGLDLRSASARRRSESGASVDAASYRCGTGGPQVKRGLDFAFDFAFDFARVPHTSISRVGAFDFELFALFCLPIR
jgi:hypothetical protein